MHLCNSSVFQTSCVQHTVQAHVGKVIGEDAAQVQINAMTLLVKVD